MAVRQRVSEQTYQEIALGDDDRIWELHDGQLVEKPGMGAEHNDVLTELVVSLHNQLDRREYRVRSNSARLRYSPANVFVPDVVVVPAALERALRGRPRSLETYPEPLPLVVETWSPSTGRYDVRTKLEHYQRRGDLEIWRIHPYERTLTAWRRQPDGTYAETVHRGGIIRPEFLPNVAIDFDALFED